MNTNTHTQTAYGKNPDTDKKKMWSLGHRKLTASPAQRSFSQCCLEGNNHSFVLHSLILYSHSINPQKVSYETKEYRIGQILQIIVVTDIRKI